MANDDEYELDDAEEDPEGAGWDALDVLKARAAASRSERDEAIRELRRLMTDDEIREDFGLDLRGLEG